MPSDRADAKDDLTRFDVVIIGAGIVGSSSAMTLSKENKKVLLLEQFAMNDHRRGASHGGSRRIGLLELAPGPRVGRAWKAWMELQNQFPQAKLFTLTGEVIITKLFPHGLLLLPFFALWAFFKKLSGHAAPFSCDLLFTRDQVASRLPKCFRFGWNTAGVYVKEAAMLHANNIVGHFQEQAKKHGADLRPNTKAISVKLSSSEKAIVETSAGSFACSHVVIAAGGWSGELLKGLGIEGVHTNVQTWTCPNFDTKNITGLTHKEQCPQFNFLNQGMYGFPCTDDLPNLTIRQIQKYDEGDDPAYHQTNDQHVAVIQGLLENHIPSVERKPKEVYTCRYCQITLDSDVGKQQILDIVPGTHGRVILASGMDGYGFKYGSIFGEEVLDIIQGRPGPVGLEWDRKPAENKVLFVLHKAIDKLISITFTSVDIVFLVMMALMWMASSKAILHLQSTTLLQAGFFTLVCLMYGPGSELVFRRPTAFNEVAVVAKVWLAHFLVIGGVVPLVLFVILGFESSSSLASSSTANLLNLGALTLRFFVMGEAGKMYCRKWMGKYHSSKTTRLIRSGPYQYVRHPGFSAHILQTMAVAVFLVGGGSWRLIVTMLVQFAGSYIIFMLSANREEQALLADPDMAEEYRNYMIEVPMQFIPDVRVFA